MKKLGLIVPAAAVAAALLVPALGTAQVTAPAFAPKNCSKPKVAPARLTISCGDGNFYVRSIKWDDVRVGARDREAAAPTSTTAAGTAQPGASTPTR